MAAIEKRGSSYRVTWRLGGSRDGARQSVSFTAPKPEAALELARRAKKLAEAHEHRITRAEVAKAILGDDNAPPDGAITLAQWVKMWAKSREPANPDMPGFDEIQPDTLAGYVQVLNLRVLPYLGHKYLHEIDEDALKEWVKTLKATRVRRTKANPGGHPISAATVRRAHAVLHLVLGAAVPQFIPRNPAARPAGVRKTRIGLPKVAPFEGMYLTPSEVNRIHACCSPQIKDLWFVLVNTGLRLGEALVLRVQDVTVEGDEPEIRVVRALKHGGHIGPPKSAKSRRVVTVSTEVAKVLAERCKGRRPRDLIFPCPGKRRKGVEPTWCENNLYRQYWMPAVAEAMRCEEHPPPPPPKPSRGPTRKLRPDEVSTCGCPGVLRRRPRLHDARHTHASELIRAGWTLHEVQERLGHASPLTTLTIYAHAWRGKHRARLDDLAAARIASEDEI